MNAAALLEELLDVLLRQEAALGELVELAIEEQSAIIHSDYAAIHRVSEQMLAVSNAIDRLDERRAELASRLGHQGALDELAQAAEDLGVDGFGPARERLLAQATRLRQAQEENARLILGAVRVRERWLALLTGLAAPTYGSAGRQQLRQERGIVSRSA